MRVVLDTNILARVFASPHGPAGDLFDLLVRSRHRLIMSAEGLTELSQTLGHDRLRKLHGLDDKAIEQFVDRLAAGALTVALPDPLPRIVPDDPHDDFLVATAVAGRADVICTRNSKHLGHPDVMAYCAERSIRIIGDLELLHELRAGLGKA